MVARAIMVKSDVVLPKGPECIQVDIQTMWRKRGIETEHTLIVVHRVRGTRYLDIARNNLNRKLACHLNDALIAEALPTSVVGLCILARLAFIPSTTRKCDAGSVKLCHHLKDKLEKDDE